MKTPIWLFPDSEFELLSNNYDNSHSLWANGMIGESDAESLFVSTITDLDNPGCPHCGVKDQRHYRVTDTRWKCRKCRKKFIVKTGLYLDNWKLPLPYVWRFCWFIAKTKELNTHAIARDLSITQASSWRLVQVLKQAMRDSGIVMKNGTLPFTSIDEIITLLMKVVEKTKKNNERQDL